MQGYKAVSGGLYMKVWWLLETDAGERGQRRKGRVQHKTVPFSLRCPACSGTMIPHAWFRGGGQGWLREDPGALTGPREWGKEPRPRPLSAAPPRMRE